MMTDWMLKNKRLIWIISFVVIELLAIYLFKNQFEEFLDFIKDKKIQIIVPLLLASPIALLIWHWRDQNKRAEIQNAEDTLRQHDFHQVVKWAGDESNDILRTASINMLLSYIEGRYGNRYKEPAKEIYRTLLVSKQEEKADGINDK